MNFSLEEVDPSWRPFFSQHITSINGILDAVQGEQIAPARESIFRAFTFPLDNLRVLILGQDPYPGVGVADGLAFLGTGTRMSPLRLLRAHDTCTGASKPGTKRL